ncbi:hypothetical protein NEF87_004788 [Candidatus Lokiarchaeum ossiferum]|uniref:Uncharacterized protein n=1 Tax=Candidatus Lokiarchaeum ossiferum TaxID=2951803 RepID=A0ABY6HY90_9ARCH|nr:hypothetical protein NEF87_004788 [Candidatus Lokiarchaeum sp. B-35]
MTIIEYSSEFVTPELLYSFLFLKNDLIIKPFAYEKDLNGLLAILKCLYSFEEADTIDLNETGLDNLELFEEFLPMLNEENEGARRKIQVFRNFNQEALNILANFCQTNPKRKFRFILLDSINDNSYNKFKQVMIFDKKTRSVHFSDNLSKIDTTDILFQFIQENIIQKLQSGNYLTVTYYLTSKIWDSMEYIVKDFLFDFNENEFYLLMKDFDQAEYTFLLKLCSSYHDLILPTHIPTNILEFCTHFTKRIDQSSSDLSSNLNQTEEQSYTEEIEEIEAINSNLQFMQELETIDINPDYKKAFDVILFEEKEKICPKRPHHSPESVYCYLRENEWKEEIPISFFTRLLQHLIQQYLKIEKISKSGLIDRVRLEHEKLKDIFSNLIPNRFKFFSNIDKATFLNDTVIKERLAPEEYNQIHLPYSQSNLNTNIPPDLDKLPKLINAQDELTEEDATDLIDTFSGGKHDLDEMQDSEIKTQIECKIHEIRKALDLHSPTIITDIKALTQKYLKKVYQL